MGRPKRRRGGGRVTPKKKRVHYEDELGADLEFHDSDYRYEAQIQLPDDDQHTGFDLELLTRDAEHLLEGFSTSGSVDMDEADDWSSCIQTEIATRRSPSGADPAAVLAHAERVGGLAGAVLAASVAVYGPADARARARRAMRGIREADPDVPDWIETLGKAEPLRATRTTDRWGEHCKVRVDYQRPDGTAHGVSVCIEPFGLAMATHFTLGPPGTQCTAAGGEGQLVEDLDLADARAIIEAGLVAGGEFGVDEDDPIDIYDTSPDGDLRALLEQRLALLPEGGRAPAAPALGADEGAAHFADFLSHGLRLGEHPDEMHDLGRTMLAFAMMCHDRDILRWTPPRATTFLEQWLPDHGLFCTDCGESHEHPPDEEWLTTVESAFPRWLRYAAGRRGLPDDALEENLAAARRSLKQMRLHATGSPVRLSPASRVAGSL